MRGVLLIAAAVVGSACMTPMLTTTTIPTRRLAFTSLPTPQPAIQGTTGVGLRANFLPGAPRSINTDGAIAFPLFQPELGVLVKLGKSSYLGGRMSATSASFGVQAPAGSVALPNEAFAMEVALGGGHDFQFTDMLGLSLSGELGGASTTISRTADKMRLTNSVFVPVGRATAGLFFTAGKFRIYAGGTVGTSVLNGEAGTLTTTCQFDCTVRETGRFDVIAMGMAGGGVRWQANELFSLAVEAWVPLNQLQLVPPVLSLTVRAGDFGTSPPPPKPLPPPPPPPSVTPEPEQPAPQL